MILFWSNEVMSNGDPAKQFCDANGICDFSRSINGIGPENNLGNPARVQYFTDMLDTLGLPYQRTAKGSVRGGVQFDRITVDTNQAATGPEAPVSSTAAPASNAAAPADGSKAAQVAQSCYENSSNCNSDHCPSGLKPWSMNDKSCRCDKSWTAASQQTSIHRCGRNWLQCSEADLTAFDATPSAGQCRCGSNWPAANAGQVSCIYQSPQAPVAGSGRRLRGGIETGSS